MQYEVVSQEGAPRVFGGKIATPKKREGDEFVIPKKIRQKEALPFGTIFNGDKIKKEGMGVVTILNLTNNVRYVMSDRFGTYIIQSGVQPLTLEERITVIENKLKEIETLLEAKG